LFVDHCGCSIATVRRAASPRGSESHRRCGVSPWAPDPPPPGGGPPQPRPQALPFRPRPARGLTMQPSMNRGRRRVLHAQLAGPFMTVTPARRPRPGQDRYSSIILGAMGRRPGRPQARSPRRLRSRDLRTPPKSAGWTGGRRHLPPRVEQAGAQRLTSTRRMCLGPVDKQAATTERPRMRFAASLFPTWVARSFPRVPRRMRRPAPHPPTCTSTGPVGGA
jgi:hypothetical protein